MSVQEINPIQEFNSSIFPNGKEKELFKRNCPHCHNEEVKIHSHYKTKNNGERKILICQECESLFSEMYNTPIAGLVTPLDLSENSQPSHSKPSPHFLEIPQSI